MLISLLQRCCYKFIFVYLSRPDVCVHTSVPVCENLYSWSACSYLTSGSWQRQQDVSAARSSTSSSALHLVNLNLVTRFTSFLCAYSHTSFLLTCLCRFMRLCSVTVFRLFILEGGASTWKACLFCLSCQPVFTPMPLQGEGQASIFAALKFFGLLHKNQENNKVKCRNICLVFLGVVWLNVL